MRSTLSDLGLILLLSGLLMLAVGYVRGAEPAPTFQITQGFHIAPAKVRTLPSTYGEAVRLSLTTGKPLVVWVGGAAQCPL